MKKWGALAVALSCAAVMLVSSAGAAEQSLTAQLSTRTGANHYLLQHGLSPRGFVIQRGTHNYAGPNCPGKGWTCTTSKRVLQVSDQAGHVNSAECSGAGIVTDQPGDCEIVQSNTDGSNVATCNQSSSSETAQQRCVVFQTNNGGGGNVVHMSQLINASSELGNAQDVHQYIGINQQNQGGGSNTVDNAATTVINDETVSYTQAVELSQSGGRDQSQNSLQEISLTQNNTSGNNSADQLNQVLVENEQSNANDGQVIDQRQNTTATSPNTNSGINQTTSSGTNSANLSQSHDLSELATGDSQGIVQAQGSPAGGINSVVNQQDNSDSGNNGISNFNGSQTENQTENVDGGTIKGQTQVGPMWADPGSATLTQNTTQHIFPNTGGQSPGQHDSIFLNCDGSNGSCDTSQTMTQNNQENGQECGNPPCYITMSDRIGGTCGPNPCPQPPAPPLPTKPNGVSTCALIATIDSPPDPKQIKIEVQDSAGVSDINVDQHTNATTDINPQSYQGSTDPIIVTATKTDQTKGSFVKLTITNGNGDTTTCDPFVPASHKKAALKKKPAKAHVAKSKGLTLKFNASGLVYGQPAQLTLTGTVPNGKAGEKVTLLTATCGFKGFAPLATMTTGPGGVFRYSFAPALGGAYAVKWNGITSAKKGIRVQPQIAVVRVGNGYRIDVSTTNGVFLTGTKVTLQALAGGHWKTLAIGKLAPNSPVDVMTAVSSAKITTAAAGKKLRAIVPATTCYTSATSGALGA